MQPSTISIEPIIDFNVMSSFNKKYPIIKVIIGEIYNNALYDIIFSLSIAWIYKILGKVIHTIV